jgi:hypothetical protein
MFVQQLLASSPAACFGHAKSTRLSYSLYDHVLHQAMQWLLLHRKSTPTVLVNSQL